MSARQRSQLAGVLVALVVVAAAWAVVRWATGRPWLALLAAGLVAGVALRLALEAPVLGPVVRSAGVRGSRWLRGALEASVLVPLVRSAEQRELPEAEQRELPEAEQ